MSDEPWPFEDPRNVAVFATVQIVRLGAPILYVSHDADDGSWQFHTGSDRPIGRDALILALSEIADLDPNILELADLPCGWHAERETPSSPWIRSRN